MRKLVDCIIRVVSDPESMKNPQLLNDTISGYDALKYEWGNLLQENNGGNYKEGFHNFMKSVEIVNLKDDEIDGALEYLRGHLEGEVGLWKEVEVKETLKDWRLSQKEVRPAPVPPVDMGYPGGGIVGLHPSFSTLGIVQASLSSALAEQNVRETPVITDYHGDITKKRNELKDKLKFMPSTEAKDLLQEIVEKEGGFILDTLLKYVQ